MSLTTSFGQVVEINLDTCFFFHHNPNITTLTAIQNKSIKIDSCWVINADYTFDFEKMIVTCKSFNGDIKTFKIVEKNNCDCVCSFTFLVECNDQPNYVIDVLVTKTLTKPEKCVTYFRCNGWDKKGNPVTIGSYTQNTIVLKN